MAHDCSDLLRKFEHHLIRRNALRDNVVFSRGGWVSNPIEDRLPGPLTLEETVTSGPLEAMDWEQHVR